MTNLIRLNCTKKKKTNKLKIVRKNLDLKLLQNSKTKIVTTLKSLNWDKAQVKFKKKIKLLQNLTTQIVIKLNNSNSDKPKKFKF